MSLPPATPPVVLSGPHQKFAEGIATGLNATEAYRAAYPSASEASLRAAASKLLTNDNISAEIERIRRAAEVLAGGCVLTLAMKRQFLYEVVTTAPAAISENSHLCQEFTRTRSAGRDGEAWETEKIKMPDKIRAIITDNDLASEGSDAKAADAFANSIGDIMARIRSRR